MLADDNRLLFQNVIQLFEQLKFNLSTPLLGCGGCFDLIAKKRALLLLVKILENIDNLREEQAFELRKLSHMLVALPLIIGHRVRKDLDIEDGVIYSRYEIPAISYPTLLNLLVQHIPPLIYAYRGGFKVKLDGSMLKEKRLEKNLSLNDLAQEVGISKRAIYEYERGTVDVSLETALLIEDFLDEPLVLAINLFEEMQKIGSLTLPESNINSPTSGLEKEVKNHFDEVGMKDQLWTKKFPFRVLAKPIESSDSLTKTPTTITGIACETKSESFVKKIEVTYDVSKIAQANPLVIVGAETKEKKISGVPIVSINELLKEKKKNLD